MLPTPGDFPSYLLIVEREIDVTLRATWSRVSYYG